MEPVIHRMRVLKDVVCWRRAAWCAPKFIPVVRRRRVEH